MNIDHLALLARLELTDSEKILFSSQVENVITYIDKLNELDTGSIEPTAHILPVSNVFREDELKPSLPREIALQNAPEEQDGLYCVPKIIE
ncbi:MAG: Asp-tRNA(Asn)/Glu-tRNA(Gln) amidotransferase subunit GatC [Nitrospira sp.]|nr:Asp-tRNA(Asn)/Glu-tRNA(Gln) amidotransferase subunit GatC [bacterium]MBL7048211.1 Asp-tRNA(Asn)/Glu-tRNA(Gln) amidotransferase subunit GatC [Nitrospira sp.]